MCDFFEWGEQDSNLRRLSQQIYSLSHLTALESPPLYPPDTDFSESKTAFPETMVTMDRWEATTYAKKPRASGGVRTHDLRFTKPLLCQLSYAGAGKNGPFYRKPISPQYEMTVQPPGGFINPDHQRKSQVAFSRPTNLPAIVVDVIAGHSLRLP